MYRVDSVVEPSLEDSLESSDSGVASGTSSLALARLRDPEVAGRVALLECGVDGDAKERDGGHWTFQLVQGNWDPQPLAHSKHDMDMVALSMMI